MTAKTEGVGVPTPEYREAQRRYHQYEMDKVKADNAGIIRVKFFGEENSKHLNITAEQFEAIKKIIVPEDPSPVSYDPCITGTIDIEGRKSEFMLLLDRPDVGYSQWGADNTVLWPRTDLLEGMSVSAKEWWADQQDGLTGFTVSGYWADDDTRVVTAVIEGEHQVSGGEDNVSEGGPFAVYVRAEDAAAAESKVQGTTEEDDLDE